MPRARFYSHFTKFTGGEKEVEIAAANVREAIDRLVQKYGEGFRNQLLREDGQPKEFVRIFLNNQDVRLLGDLGAETRPDDQLLFVPAVAGG